ncbi:MAG: CIA30 family protein [Pseudomonadota bacterium]
MADDRTSVIDDLSQPHPMAANGASWEFVADTVMGGVSSGGIDRVTVAGRPALRLQGTVRLDNNGGFIQAALDLNPDGSDHDARAFSGLNIDLHGDGADYDIRVRTSDLSRPWQSYRHAITAAPRWVTYRIPFASFTPHRTDRPLDKGKLRRIGVLAIGSAREARLAIGGVRFFSGS